MSQPFDFGTDLDHYPHVYFWTEFLPPCNGQL